MVSITTWTRLEPRCRDATLQDGLEARLHDPLWMLARQWQVGEFVAHDGGSAAQVRMNIANARLSRYRPASHGADAHPYDPRTQPLEAVVEREANQTGHELDLRDAAEAGLHFVRLLRRHDVAGYASDVRDRYPLSEVDRAERRRDGAADADRFLAVMGGRTIDGAQLYRALADLPRSDDGDLERLPNELPVADDDRDAVAAAAGRWLAWYEDVYGTSAQPPSAWSTPRMTYEFAVSAVTGHGEITLVAREHPGEHLDWHAFDHAPNIALRGDEPRPDEMPRETTSTVLPSRVRYRGMPTSRWWELEDAAIDYGRVETGPEDLARLVFVDLAITYSNDWFVAPVDVDVGSLSEIRWLVVTDTFGRRTLIRHHLDTDGADDQWRMYDLSAPAAHPAGRMLLVPPSLPIGQRGPAVEDVLLRRDEVANLAWAIERTVPSPMGNPLDRGRARGRSDEPADPPDPQAPFVYRLASEVPDHWFPLVPDRGPEPGTIRFVLGRILAEDGEPPAPQGVLLRSTEPLLLLDEAVPRSGVRLTLRDERGRWTDGSTHQWRARRRQVGGGEAWSGLRHDSVEPVEHPT